LILLNKGNHCFLYEIRLYKIILEYYFQFNESLFIMSFADFSKSKSAIKNDKTAATSTDPKTEVFGPTVEKPAAEKAPAKP